LSLDWPRGIVNVEGLTSIVGDLYSFLLRVEFTGGPDVGLSVGLDVIPVGIRQRTGDGGGIWREHCNEGINTIEEHLEGTGFQDDPSSEDWIDKVGLDVGFEVEQELARLVGIETDETTSSCIGCEGSSKLDWIGEGVEDRLGGGEVETSRGHSLSR